MYFVPLNYTLTSGEDADFHVIYIFYHIFLNAKEKKKYQKAGKSWVHDDVAMLRTTPAKN